MIIGKVIGNVWATRKEESLQGLKLLVIETLNYNKSVSGGEIVAADKVGAGIGDTVLITTGSSARKALNKDEVPIDAMVVGIIDEVEINS